MQTNCYGAVIYSYLLGSDLVTGFKIFLFLSQVKKKNSAI